MGKMNEAKQVAGTVLAGLAAAGMDDEAEMATLAMSLLKRHRPEVAEALSRSAIEDEIRSVASGMHVT